MSAMTAAEVTTLPVRGHRTDAEWLIAAVDLARQNVADGGGPFGAFIVQTASSSAEVSTG